MNIFHISQTTFWIAYTISNGLAILALLYAKKHPGLIRIFFLLLFLSACVTNTYIVKDSPWAYQDYADTAVPVYERFILGAFARIITPMILGVAAWQLLIGLSMLMKGRLFRAGCWAGIIFLVSIAPLGLNAAFPSTLIMAMALFRLQSNDDASYLWSRGHLTL